MFGQPTLTPAYGRDFKSKVEVLAALNEGKDFLAQGIGGSGYIALPEILEQRWATVTVRYKKLAQVVVVKIANGKAV